ncbi:MAG: ribosome maturation factor RimM [Bifidobacteriaceae bacterium]|nr:ribosome maturation factor RimM [Bifidobacteriaceae bacterium]
MEVVVAGVGRAHGVRGDVVLELRTDRPDLRFQPGSVFRVDDAAQPGGPPRLTLRSYRATTGWPVASFAELTDRTTAEALRGAKLVAEVDPAEEDQAWYPAELRGLAVELPDGTPAGTVNDLVYGPAQDWLEIEQDGAGLALVPLIERFVPVIDVPGGLVVIDPPPGLVAARPAPEDGVVA